MKFIAEVMPIENAPVGEPITVCYSSGESWDVGYKRVNGYIYSLQGDVLLHSAEYYLKFTPITDSI